ncbi:SDR family oxidoreductase [Holzapfeliella sp. He02]|uniref:SDR family oxidoreductase n=1 Tax=Holzapfeliella saturejae TaxID=3082953 RepID=A0ABU8SFH3_9LACO
MKIFVVGANGRVGRHTVKKLAEANDEVIAGVRDPETQSLVEASNVKYVEFNLHQPVEQMATAFEGSEAIVFTAGSAGKDVLKVDLDGAVKTMTAAKKAGISRYIMVSAINADRPETFPGQELHDYYIAKHYADEWLRTTDLDYVIVQPTALTDEASDGLINVGRKGLQSEISRESVAEFLTEVVRNHAINHQTIDLSDGQTPISEAIADL